MKIMGTVSSYVKGIELNKKFQERKNNSFLVDDKKQEDPRITEFKRLSEEQRRSHAISSIYGKLMSGQELSPSELEYLRKHSPDLYEKAVKIKQERAEYKRELANCRSKEDVERLRQSKLLGFASEARAISRAKIPPEEKREKLEFLTMRMNAVLNEHHKFTQSAEYQKLPATSKNDKPILPASKTETADPVRYIHALLAEASKSAPKIYGASTPSGKATLHFAQTSDSIAGENLNIKK